MIIYTLDVSQARVMCLSGLWGEATVWIESNCTGSVQVDSKGQGRTSSLAQKLLLHMCRAVYTQRFLQLSEELQAHSYTCWMHTVAIGEYMNYMHHKHNPFSKDTPTQYIRLYIHGTVLNLCFISQLTALGSLRWSCAAVTCLNPPGYLQEEPGASLASAHRW